MTMYNYQQCRNSKHSGHRRCCHQYTYAHHGLCFQVPAMGSILQRVHIFVNLVEEHHQPMRRKILVGLPKFVLITKVASLFII